VALALAGCDADTASQPTAPTTGSDLSAEALPSHPAGIIDTIIPVSGVPYGVAISRSGKILLTTDIGGSSVPRANLPNRAFTTKIPVGFAPPHVAIDASETRAYVPNQGGHSVSIVNLLTNTELSRLPLAGEGYNVAVQPDNAVAYITTNIGRVYLINIPTGAFVDSFDIDPANNGLAFGRGKSLYISSLLSGTVTLYNTSTRRVVGVLNTGGVPQRMAINTTVNELYIANESFGLDIWNLSTRSRITTIPMDAYGLGLSPDGNKIYVSGALTGTVTIVDRASRMIDATLSVGGIPRNIVFTPNGKRAVVSNQSGYVTWIR
jgi:YVTN family beta-propeller protein